MSALQHLARTTGIQILILLLTVFILRFGIQIVLRKIYSTHILHRLDQQPRIRRRLNTLIGVINNILYTIGIFGAILLILKDYINITPILAGAGVISIAISFGAQSFVKDIIAGFFFLIQDQFGVGDIVQVNTGLIGIVIEITFRTITIRDFSGNTTTFSNSVITQITNMTKDWSLFDMTLMVNANTPIDQIIEIMQEAGYRTDTDESVIDYITDGTKILGIETIGDGKVGVRVNTKTLPGRQFIVGRVYRMHVKKLLEEKNITL